MEDVLNVIGQSFIGSFCVEAVIDAHQGFDNGFLEHLSVVVVVDAEHSLNREEDDVHNAFQLILAHFSALQEQLAETHENIEL